MGIHILRSEHTKSNITFVYKIILYIKWHSKHDWFCHCRSTERRRHFIQLIPVEMLDSRRRNPLQWFQVTKSVLLNWFCFKTLILHWISSGSSKVSGFWGCPCGHLRNLSSFFQVMHEFTLKYHRIWCTLFDVNNTTLPHVGLVVA